MILQCLWLGWDRTESSCNRARAHAVYICMQVCCHCWIGRANQLHVQICIPVSYLILGCSVTIYIATRLILYMCTLFYTVRDILGQACGHLVLSVPGSGWLKWQSEHILMATHARLRKLLREHGLGPDRQQSCCTRYLAATHITHSPT